MTEEKTQNEQKNTVGTVGMRFSISWLVALIFILLWSLCLIYEELVVLWVIMLIVWGVLWLFSLWFLNFLTWFILWIIGLFYKPRGKARVAVLIPILFVVIPSIAICTYVWSSIKTPTTQFTDWIKVEFENIDDENFDNDRFNAITNEEFNNIRASLTEEEFKTLLENSTWSNTLEKWAYVLFGLLQQGFENSLERYNNELPEVDENDENELDEVVDEDSNNEEDEIETNEVEVENDESSLQNEKDDIDEIINILE